jgi:hypothetical protein
MDSQPITYQQLLAQEFSNNAKNTLVFQQEEDSVEDVDAHDYGGAGYELEEGDKFGRFAGNRNLEEDVSKAANFEDKSKLSVRYNKDVQTRVFNIDSRFRAYAVAGSVASSNATGLANAGPTILSTATSLASHFVFRTSQLIKNAMSIRMSSMEIPNIFANFSALRGNTSFRVKLTESQDWTIVDINPAVNGVIKPLYIQTVNQFCSAIQNGLRSSAVSGAANFVCNTDSSGNIAITNTTPDQQYAYSFDFSYTPISIPLFDPLGVLMGFDPNDNSTYSNVSLSTGSIVAKFPPDLEPDDYFYLRINDYATVVPQAVNDTFFTVFAKIPITVPKGGLMIDNDSTNSTTKIYRFLQPTNISQLEIQLLDRAGQELTFHGNFSMTIEIEEVVSHSLYEKLREL